MMPGTTRSGHTAPMNSPANKTPATPRRKPNRLTWPSKYPNPATRKRVRSGEAVRKDRSWAITKPTLRGSGENHRFAFFREGCVVGNCSARNRRTCGVSRAITASTAYPSLPKRGSLPPKCGRAWVLATGKEFAAKIKPRATRCKQPCRPRHQRRWRPAHQLPAGCECLRQQ